MTPDAAVGEPVVVSGGQAVRQPAVQAPTSSPSRAGSSRGSSPCESVRTVPSEVVPVETVGPMTSRRRCGRRGSDAGPGAAACGEHRAAGQGQDDTSHGGEPPLWWMQGIRPGVTSRAPRYSRRMCRSIKTLRGAEPPADDDDARAAALQFVRKISGYRVPSGANQRLRRGGRGGDGRDHAPARGSAETGLKSSTPGQRIIRRCDQAGCSPTRSRPW